MATPGALALYDGDPDILLARIANGEIPQRLAHELGVHHASIYRFLARHPEAAEARKIGMACRLDQAEVDISEADERTLGRAREMWRAVTWRAEREHPEQWGQRSQVSVVVEVGAALAEALERSQRRLANENDSRLAGRVIENDSQDVRQVVDSIPESGESSI